MQLGGEARQFGSIAHRPETNVVGLAAVALAGGGEQDAVGGKGEAGSPVGGRLEMKDELVGGEIEAADIGLRPAAAAGGHELAVGRHGEAADAAGGLELQP